MANDSVSHQSPGDMWCEVSHLLFHHITLEQGRTNGHSYFPDEAGPGWTSLLFGPQPM